VIVIFGDPCWAPISESTTVTVQPISLNDKRSVVKHVGTEGRIRPLLGVDASATEIDRWSA
jgi:hypothetical protein